MESFSQFGEDVQVWSYLNQKKDGFFVEVGANAPFDFSQTWLFEKNGWKGILVEPLSSKCNLLRSERKNSRVFQVAAGAPEDRGELTLEIPEDDMFAALRPRDKVPKSVKSEVVNVVTLDDVLAEAGSPKLDYVSIDVEGLELNVLRGFNLEKHKPSIMLVEDHLKSLVVCKHLWGRGYKLVKRTGCNNWFIPKEAQPPPTTAMERFKLWKRIWVHTPLAVVREALRAWRKRR